MSELLRNFKQETLELVEIMVQKLESAEEGDESSELLSTFAQLSDRIMGGAKQLEMDGYQGAGRIADLSALLKVLGYKASRLEPFSSLLTVSIGVLLDATGELKNMINQLGEGKPAEGTWLSSLIDRLEWLDSQFGPEIHGGVPDSVRIDGEFGGLLSRIKNRQKVQ